jgi:dihydrofolate reductase
VGDDELALADRRPAAGRDIGGATLAAAAMRAGLIDEYAIAHAT